MNSANANRVVRWDFCLFLAGIATAVVLLDSACEQTLAQTKPAAAKPAVADPAAVKPAAKPATQPGAAAPQPAAQGAKPATAPAKPAVPAKADAAKGEPKDEPPPAPENFFVRTDDGWNIFCTFYGPKKGVRRGKDVVPIIMLHGWEGQGSEYAELATLLQSWGFASIVPDLRGHGRSLGVMRRKPNGEEEEKVVKADDLTPQDMEGMVNDVEAVRKKVLVDKNDAQSLNLAMLCVVASDVGTIVALNWSAHNWNQPVLPNGFKFGQDVKALVLLSPQQNFKRINCSAALTHPVISRNLSIMIAVGEQQNRDFSEAKRIHSRLERLRPPVPAEERMQKQDLFLIAAPTPLQGTKLLDRALPVGGAIMKFLDLRLLRKLELYPWSDRKPPLVGN